jgi:hypothetical protein
VHKDGWNFRCPICGDSKKSKFKKRGWILPSVDKVVYYCHNCFTSITFRNFISQTHPDVFEKYKQKEKEVMFEKMKDGTLIRGKLKKFNVIAPHIERELELFDPNPKYFLPLTEEALAYCKKRKFPEGVVKNMFWTAKYDDKGEPWTYGDALCFPLWKGDKMYGFQVRHLKNKKFFTYCKQEAFKVYNIFNVDLTAPVYIFEAIIDSFAMSNSIAVLGASIQKRVLDKIEHPVFIYDNDTTGRKQALKQARLGREVFVWPDNVKGKDFNYLVAQKDWAPDKIRMMVIRNVFSGIEAEMKLSAQIARSKK